MDSAAVRWDGEVVYLLVEGWGGVVSWLETIRLWYAIRPGSYSAGGELCEREGERGRESRVCSELLVLWYSMAQYSIV